MNQTSSQTPKLPEEKRWRLYIILCSDQSLYTGITTDIERRFAQHRGGKGGARYFRGRQPLRIVHLEIFADRSSASRREYAIKQLSRQQKLKILNQYKSN